MDAYEQGNKSKSHGEIFCIKSVNSQGNADFDKYGDDENELNLTSKRFSNYFIIMFG